MMMSKTKRETDQERAHRLVHEDDLETWAATGGDLSRWPRDWNREPTMGARNPYFIPRPVRPYYSRSAERDAEVMGAWPEDRQETPDGDVFGSPLPVNGYPVTLSGKDPDKVCHWYAMQQAHGRKRAEERRRTEEARDHSEFRCQSCSVIDRADVRWRDVGGFRTVNPLHIAGTEGPCLCSACAALAGFEIERRLRDRVELKGAETISDGRTRIDAVQTWIEENSERIMRT